MLALILTKLKSFMQLVYDMMIRMRKEISSEELTIMPEIDNLILIDRDVDMVTPCCTQLTYEGLVDETFSIQNGMLCSRFCLRGARTY